MFFTLCYVHELGNAQLLGESLKKFHPEIPFTIFLADNQNHIPTQYIRNFNIETIDNEILRLLGAKYNWRELKDNCKPYIAQQLLQNHSQIVYLDCSSYVFENLDVVLKNEANILLIPQLLFANQYPKENEALNEGIYHAGFFMLRQSEETMRFVNWWKEKTFAKGFEQVCKGMNKDRLILELVPVLFKGVFVEKNPAINVGKWNVAERDLVQKDGRYLIKNKKLITYNFKDSPYFDELQKQLKKYQFLCKIKPHFGIPVRQKTLAQKVFSPPLQQIIKQIDIFFDKF